jgi:hypothetical protein
MKCDMFAVFTLVVRVEKSVSNRERKMRACAVCVVEGEGEGEGEAVGGA